jgi:polyvinyl alcohol dehydrogenase (cytochrome)
MNHGGTNAACQSPNNHADSILALDMWTGKIKWANRLENWNQQTTEGVTNGSDFWNVDCFVTRSNCPPTTGPDYDFGSAPNEITYNTHGGPKTIIGAGQKSGIYYAVDPDTGALLWQSQVGPGSSLGGMEWGSASDGTRIYVQITNLYGIPYSAFGLPASLGNAGSWAALDPATGKILWQVADPNKGSDLGPIAVSNGVVFAPSMGAPPPAGCTTNCTPGLTSPNMFALDASTGNILWSFTPGSSVNAGAVIVDSSVYWGSGYVHLAPSLGSGSTTAGAFYAFSLPGGDQD